jgi:hypothetical protein
VKLGQIVRVGVAVAGHPSLWLTALRQWRRTTPHGWWRRPPYLPVPSREYVQFRLVTQYGSINAPVPADDVLNYLLWCKQQRS